MTVSHTEEEIHIINTKVDELIGYCKRCTAEEKQKILEAFQFADKAHMGVRRKSGIPYIMHPIEVAIIVAYDMGLEDSRSICAALLHDVVEDTDYTLDDIEAKFGETVKNLVDGLTKIEGVIGQNQSKQAENFKRILLTLVDDVRVVIVKLADRLQNMRTLGSMSPKKQIQIASETLYIFAPLANRMGFFSIKTELEDLSFKYYNPEEYNEVEELIAKRELESENFVNEFEQPIIEKLKSAGITFLVSRRYKSVYSTWRKMQRKKIPFEEVYDLFAIRIVFDPSEGIPERTQCWHIYSLITEIYKSKIDRIRDWAGTPKVNGYEALHCTLLSKSGIWVEVQIRSQRMDEIAEKGIATHWKYKNAGKAEESALDIWVREVKNSLGNPDIDALEFLDQFKQGLVTPDIMVYTPKGETRTLPNGATALDFAFDIHTEIGSKAIAVKVNHVLKPLNHPLESGDQVEIITTANQVPKKDWLEFVTTDKAKSIIKAFIKSETQERRKKGRIIIEEKLNNLGIQPSSRTYRKLVLAYKQTDKNELFTNVGSGLLDLAEFEKVLKENTPQKLMNYWRLGTGSSLRSRRKKVSGKELKKIDTKVPYSLKEKEGGKEGLSYIVAECCNPIPGDDVVGFTNADGTEVIVHKKICPETERMAAQHGERIIEVYWTQHKVLAFLAVLSLKGIDRTGLLKDITDLITRELNINIRKVALESYDGIFEGEMELYLHNKNDLNRVIEKLASIKGIYTVQRIEHINESHIGV